MPKHKLVTLLGRAWASPILRSNIFENIAYLVARTFDNVTEFVTLAKVS